MKSKLRAQVIRLLTLVLLVIFASSLQYLNFSFSEKYKYKVKHQWCKAKCNKSVHQHRNLLMLINRCFFKVE